MSAVSEKSVKLCGFLGTTVIKSYLGKCFWQMKKDAVKNIQFLGKVFR